MSTRGERAASKLRLIDGEWKRVNDLTYQFMVKPPEGYPTMKQYKKRMRKEAKSRGK